MSRYPQKVILNNPEKNVPDDIVSQFFLAIKTADIDKIREFALKYKNKYNLIEKLSLKGKGTTDSEKTPYHSVLELDDKIADNDTKLRIMEYLALMGAPMDLPDSKDVWPIHLAVESQSIEIVDFFLKNNVNINRKDSSNNTPLHYAITGKEISCKNSIRVGSLTPVSASTESNLNKTLENTKNALTKLLNENSLLNDNIIHIINTIMRIPEMYLYDKFERTLSTNIINIFSETALSTNYFSGMDVQQTKLEQLIENTYSTISDDLLKGLTNPISIGPSKAGWGPKNNLGKDALPQERILDKTRGEIAKNIENEYIQLKNNITNIAKIPTDTIIRTTIPQIVDVINVEYIDKLIFCNGCAIDTTDYGEEVSLLKTLFLLTTNSLGKNYASYLTNKILSTYNFMSTGSNSAIRTLGDPGRNWSNGNIVYVMGSDLDYLIENLPQNEKTKIDIALRTAYNIAVQNGVAVFEDYIRNNLKNIITPQSIQGDSRNINQSILATTSIKNLLKNPLFSTYVTDFEVVPGFNTTLSWLDTLKNQLQVINPQPTNPVNNIFNLPPNTLPQTFVFYDYAQRPIIAANRQTDYNIWDCFQIFGIIFQYLTDGDFQVLRYNPIYDNPVFEWIDYVNNLGLNSVYSVPTNPTINQNNPILLTLYKILITYTTDIIKNILVDCINDTINDFVDLDNTEITDLIKVLIKDPFDDAYLYNLLLPSYPVPEYFTIEDPDTDFLAVYKSNKWTENNSLVNAYQIFQNNLPINSLNNLLDIFYNIDFTDALDYGQLQKLRTIIETNTDILKPFLNPVIKNNIRQYFGTAVKTQNFYSIDAVPTFNSLSSSIDLVPSFSENLSKLASGKITKLFFLTEVHGYFFVTIKQSILSIQNYLIILNNIIVDIMSFINNKTYYYIPQIFLPALIKQIIYVLQKIIGIKNILDEFQKQKSEYYSIIDLKVRTNNSIINLSNLFTNYVEQQLNIMYNNIIEIAKFHNNVIDFLNFNSAYLLMTGRNSPGKRTRLFDMNLTQLEPLPITPIENSNFSQLISIFNYYAYPKTVYYANPNDQTVLNYDVLDSDAPVGTNATKPFAYRSTIVYNRKGKISNCPTVGENSQLNITKTTTDPTVFTIVDIPTPIDGVILKFDFKNPSATFYADSFIAYKTTNFNIQWLEGMPPSIKRLVAEHLFILKQKIIEETIQYVIDNSKNETDPSSTFNIYNSLKTLGNNSTYTSPDVKVYIMIGKLVDEILNKLIEYTTRQSVSNWIYQHVSNNNTYKSIVDTVKSKIDIIRKNDYEKLSLSEINKDSITELLKINPKYLDFKLTQIESNPQSLPYSTNKDQKQFMNYLYNINYFSTSNLSENKRCYWIDPRIVKKLITSDTINSKNSDGNTPLHLAVELGYPTIIEKLLDKGAKVNGFTNLQNMTPLTMAISNLQKHLSFTKGTTVSKTLHNFTFPFNDLLLSRIRDDRFKNNVIKKITMAIPIQFVMYNHMIYLYMQNYRYNFNFEIKNNIILMFEKYFGIKNKTFPTDLFEISGMAQLEKVLEPENIHNKIDNEINSSQIKKIKSYEKSLHLVLNQITNLQKEKPTDPNQIKMLNDLLSILNTNKIKLTQKIKSVQLKKKPIVDPAIMTAYISTVRSIENKVANRSMDLLDFYKTSFGRVGKTKDLYIGIWNNYLEKNLLNTTTMIFPLINQIISILIEFIEKNSNVEEAQSNLKTVVNFMTVAKTYIEDKSSFPENLDDNPILREEISQIIYLINLILTPSVKNIIFNQIYLSVKEMTTITVESATTIEPYLNQNDVFNEITSVEFNNLTIDKYLTDYLPILATKYYTTIYNNYNDTDKTIVNAEDLFSPIIQTIKATRLIQITDDSVLIQNFQEYLIPFLANTYHNFIYHLRLCVYGYERYILNTYQLVKTIELLMQK